MTEELKAVARAHLLKISSVIYIAVEPSIAADISEACKAGVAAIDDSARQLAQLTAELTTLKEMRRPDTDCNNDVGRCCRELWPADSASWCPGCLQAALAEVTAERDGEPTLKQLKADYTHGLTLLAAAVQRAEQAENERDEARQSAQTLGHQLERRANGQDALTQQLITERDEALAQSAALRDALEQLPRYEVSTVDDMLLPDPSADGVWLYWPSVRALLIAPPEPVSQPKEPT